MATIAKNRYAGRSVADLARLHTLEAIDTLVYHMRNVDKPTQSVQAASILLDRGWGKAVQPVADGNGHEALALDLSRFSASQLDRMEATMVELLAASKSTIEPIESQGEAVSAALNGEPVSLGEAMEGLVVTLRDDMVGNVTDADET